MLVVKIELHSAITGKVTEIGRMHIVNDGTGDVERGNYNVELMRRGTERKVQRFGRVTNHARLSYSVWRLVSKALAAVGFDDGEKIDEAGERETMRYRDGRKS
jgi:hypothetical protein